MFDIFRDLGVLGLVCLGLCKEQLFHKFLRSWNVERAAQKIVLHHIKEQLVDNDVRSHDTESLLASFVREAEERPDGKCT